MITESSISWHHAESLLKQGLARAYREFPLRQISKLVNPHHTVTENLNKLYYLIHQPWTNGIINASSLSFLHPIYIVLDGGYFVLKMHNGKVEKAKQPGALEFRYFGYIIRISKPLKPNEKSMHLYNGPYTDDNVRSKVNFYLHERAKNDD